MTPRPLVFLNETEPRCYACGMCGTVARTEAEAARCCLCHVCRTRVPTRRYHACDECQATLDAARAAKRRADLLALLRAATQIPADEYGGPVCESEHGEPYHESVGDLLDCYEEGGGPAYAWACHVERARFDAGAALEAAAENGEYYEDFEWVDPEGLEAFVCGWNAQQPETWMVDTRRVVVIDASAFRALLEET